MRKRIDLMSWVASEARGRNCPWCNARALVSGKCNCKRFTPKRRTR